MVSAGREVSTALLVLSHFSDAKFPKLRPGALPHRPNNIQSYFMSMLSKNDAPRPSHFGDRRKVHERGKLVPLPHVATINLFTDPQSMS